MVLCSFTDLGLWNILGGESRSGLTGKISRGNVADYFHASTPTPLAVPLGPKSLSCGTSRCQCQGQFFRKPGLIKRPLTEMTVGLLVCVVWGAIVSTSMQWLHYQNTLSILAGGGGGVGVDRVQPDEKCCCVVVVCE